MQPELVALAEQLARRFHLAGADADDVRQVALIAAWRAEVAWRPELGAPLLPFAAVVIGRKLREAVTAARRRKHGPLTDAVRVAIDADGDPVVILELLPDRGADVVERVELRLELERLAGRLATLTACELEAVRERANGSPGWSRSKRLDNAAQRADRKLRAA